MLATAVTPGTATAAPADLTAPADAYVSAFQRVGYTIGIVHTFPDRGADSFMCSWVNSGCGPAPDRRPSPQDPQLYTYPRPGTRVIVECFKGTYLAIREASSGMWAGWAVVDTIRVEADPVQCDASF